MITERIYRSDVYAKTNAALVTAVRDINGHAVISTDRSVFFPEGGGQPGDVGSVSLGENIYSITGTYDENLEGEVFHITDAPSGSFAIGDRVELSLDWDKRLSNMQRHLGEHMLSGCLYNLYGGVNRGFHMGEEYITIDIDLGGRMLSTDELERAGELVNRAIWDDLPVTVEYFDNYEDSRIMPVRKDVPHDGRVSVVTVWGADGVPFDCIACCGTHPSSTGQVGVIAIYKLEVNKGMNRIYFDCGANAYRKLNSDMRLLNDISNRFSTGVDNLMHKLDIQAAKEAELRERLSALSGYAKEKFISDRKPALQDSPCRITAIRTDLFDTNELLKLGFDLSSELAPESILILIDSNSNTALLYGGTDADCAGIVKETAASYGGKGGGKPCSARAVFSCGKDLSAWLTSLDACICL